MWPPSVTRRSRALSASAIHRAPSESRQQPAPATLSSPNSLSMARSDGSGANSAQTRRLVRRPSSVRSKAVLRLPNVSLTISTLSGVITVPLGNHRSSGTSVTVPSVAPLGPGAAGVARGQPGGRKGGAAHQVEPEVADVGPARGVDGHVVGVTGGGRAQVDVDGQGGVGLSAEQLG